MAKKVINGIVIALSILLIGFVMILSLLPNMVLNIIISMGGFALPVFIIIVTMIIEIQISKDIQEKNKIRNFWLKMLLIIYCLLLVTILFLNNEYRMNGFKNINIFSREHFEMSNFVPFATIISYISRLMSDSINTSIVIINLATNLLLLAPMGFFIPLLFKNKITNVKQFLILIIVLTVSIEILQFITYRGATDIDDIILNTIGAFTIYMLMKTRLVKKVLRKVLGIKE